MWCCCAMRRSDRLADPKPSNMMEPGSRASQKLSRNALVADGTSAQPYQPGDCGLALSAVGSGSALPHGRQHNRQCVASDSGRASHQTRREGYTTMSEWRVRERKREHVVFREGSVSG